MRISSIQLAANENSKEQTLAHVLSLLQQTRGSDLVLLPELWPCGAFSSQRFQADAESIDGPILKALRAKAVELKIHLLAGSIVERDAGKLYNTSVLIGPNGRDLARYRKIHLFGYQSEESKLMSGGNDVVVVDLPWGKTGLAICYDLRFPELFRNMVDAKAECFVIASGWPLQRVDAWTLFNRARAHENLAFLFSCNSAGISGGKQMGGNSMIVDPSGKVLACGGTEECIVTADVDFELVRKTRSEFPALNDRVIRTNRN
jgi:predicted amidohydrolase